MRSKLGLLFATALAACSAHGDGEVASNGAEITALLAPAGIQEAVPNCWVFGATAWLESLSARSEGAVAVDLSEAYVSYAYWFEQITQGPVWEYGGNGTSILPNGWWGMAVEILRRYGWMPETTFLGLARPVDYAARHQAALGTLRVALASGELSTAEARADRAHVVRVMNAAWGLSPAVAADLATVFGAGYERTLLEPSARAATVGTRVRRLSEIPVGYTRAGVPVTGADVVGLPAEGSPIHAGQRAGAFAFSEIVPPWNGDASARRDYLRRAQKALNQDLPVVMAEWSDDAQVDATGTYQRPASGQLSSSAYSHVVMAYDLSVQTPRFGLLPAGVTETRPEVLAASLADDAKVVSFRTKNSYWGTYADGSIIAFAGATGTNDFTADYWFGATTQNGIPALIRTALPNDPDVVVLRAPPAL